MPVWLIYLQIFIILLLIAIAAYYCTKLFRLRTRNRKLLAEQALQSGSKRAGINNSIQIICRSLLAGQVESAEASIRISALMDQLSVPESKRSEFIAFDTMTSAIKHIPVLDAWKALGKEERQQYRIIIEKKQEELEPFILEAARKLLGQLF